ncbi:MAG: methyl-accepting chemotaxis protein [bacterium]
MKNKSWIAYLTLSAIIGLLAVYSVYTYYQRRVEIISLHKTVIEEEFEEKEKQIEEVFRDIYQGIRTMSLLPTIRNIDPYGENLSKDGDMTIQQIYNNTAENTGLSEIYAVDINMDPEATDPKTGKLMEPIFTYDQLIVGNRGNGNSDTAHEGVRADLEEVEVYEYRAMRKQLSYFKKHFPRETLVHEMDVPGIISRELITCDNSDFTGKDLAKGDNSKRNGFVYSVPFYSDEGKLKGMISAVFRSEVLTKRYVAKSDMAIDVPMGRFYGMINPNTDYRLVFEGSRDIFNRFDTHDNPVSSDGLFAEVATLKIKDKNQWKLYCYVPMNVLASQIGEQMTILGLKLVSLLVILSIGSAFIYFVSRQKEVLLEFVDHLDYLIKGDLTRRIEGDYKREVGALVDRFNQFVKHMEGIIGRVLRMINHIAASSEELSSESQNLSRRSQQQAASLEETSSTVQQMTSTIKANARNAEKADHIVRTASGNAQAGEKVVQKTVVSMSEVTESSQKIAEITGLVDEIAFQTNLLALNAAVEAARAGEQGKGFAVVADEIRRLAGRSAEAAKDIQILIEDVVEKITTGNTQVEETGKTLNDIIGGIKNVVVTINEITANYQEQTTGIDQVSRGVVHLDNSVQENASLSEETASISEILASQSEEMRELMARFKVSQSSGMDK